MITCPKCKGSGHIEDPRDVGKNMRTFRMDQKISQRHIAKLMGFSPMYVCDLELGRRDWTEDLKQRYVTAVEEALLERT